MTPTARLLIACPGGAAIGGGHKANLAAATPLAVDGTARELVDSIGEDQVGEWLLAHDARAPRAGGLWVAELSIVEDSEAPEGWGLEGLGWREPTALEIYALIERQKYWVAVAKYGKAEVKESGSILGGEGAWAYKGALL